MGKKRNKRNSKKREKVNRPAVKVKKQPKKSPEKVPEQPKKKICHYSHFGDDRKKTWIELLGRTHNVSAACEAVGIDRSTAYRAADKDPKFKAAWQKQEDVVLDAVESVLYKKALEGDRVALIFLLCNRRPERWSNAHRTEIRGTGKDGEILIGDPTFHRKELVRRIAAAVSARIGRVVSESGGAGNLQSAGGPGEKPSP